MKTTVDLPDDLVSELKQRAARDGRALAEEVVHLLRKGLSASPSSAPTAIAPRIEIDPTTGLPVITATADAPISRMSTEQIYALIHSVQEEEDFARFGLSLRR